jgi:hypothetical protein
MKLHCTNSVLVFERTVLCKFGIVAPASILSVLGLACVRVPETIFLRKAWKPISNIAVWEIVFWKVNV